MSFRRHHQEWVCARKEGTTEISKYRCSICGRTHQSVRALNKHKTISHNDSHTTIDYIVDTVIEIDGGCDCYTVLGTDRTTLARYGATIKRHRGVTTRRGSNRVNSEATSLENNIDLLDQVCTNLH